MAILKAIALLHFIQPEKIAKGSIHQSTAKNRHQEVVPPQDWLLAGSSPKFAVKSTLETHGFAYPQAIRFAGNRSPLFDKTHTERHR